MVSGLSVLHKLQVRGKSREIKCGWIRWVSLILRRVTILSSLHDLRFDEDQVMGVGLIVASLLCGDFWSVQS